MSTLVIAQCTDAKKRHECQAKDLYMESQYFAAQRRYAEAYGDEWVIHSAKHGLIQPEHPIAPYDVRMSDRDVTVVQDELSEAAQLLVEEYDTVELLGGKNYVDAIAPLLVPMNVQIKEPFAGLRLATRTEEMQARARKKENTSLDDYA